MKKTLKAMAMLLFAAAMVTMSSCSKEDTYQRRIIGKWECISVWYAVGNNPAQISPNQYNYIDDDNDVVGCVWEFSDDGRIKIRDGQSSASVTSTYTITEDYLNLGLAVYNIEELTNSSLKVWVNNMYDHEERVVMYEFQRVR